MAMAIAREKCSKKTQLLADYQSATARFSLAVTDLNEKMGVSPKSEYDRLRMAADDARMKSEEARLALERHTAEHGC